MNTETANLALNGQSDVTPKPNVEQLVLDVRRKDEVISEQSKLVTALEGKVKHLERTLNQMYGAQSSGSVAKKLAKAAAARAAAQSDTTQNRASATAQNEENLTDDEVISLDRSPSRSSYTSAGNQLIDDSLSLIHIQRDVAAALRMLAATRPEKPLNPSQKTFSGSINEDVDLWINSISLNMEAADTPEGKKHIVAAGYLTNGALQFYELAIKERRGLTWTQLQDELRKRFRAPNHQARIFTQLTQRGEPLAKLIDRFMILINQTDALPEHVKVTMFIKALDNELGREVAYRNKHTLFEAIQVARDYERNYGRTREETTEVFQVRSKPETKPKCFACGKPGHKAADCFKRKQTEAPGSQKPTCNYCKKRGHKEEDCYKKKAAENNAKQERSKPRPASVKSVDYGEKGSRELLEAIGTINGHRELVVFDTGAVCSVISEKLVRKYDLPRAEETRRVIMANGDEQVAATTETVTVIVNGIACQVKMIILQNNDKPVLLGLDWLEEAGAIVDIANKAITFTKRRLQLEGSENDEVSEQIFSFETANDSDDEDEYIFDQSTKINLEHLAEPEKEAITELIGANQEAFADSIDDLAKPCDVLEFEIETTSEVPLYQHPYRVSEKERHIMNSETEKMLKAGIIRESSSPWSAPALLVKKADGTPRFCVDYRRLNNITKRDVFPIPRIDSILDRLSNSTIFSCVDLKSGYWQVAMAQNSIAKTAFSTGDGHFEFIRLPFGLCNAPSIFSKIMKAIFGNSPFVEVYIDDVIVHSKSFSEHVEHLKITFDKLKQHNLRVSRCKCTLGRSEIKILGHIVTDHDIKMDPEKIQSIKDWKSPGSVNQLQQFLGICGYYRRFVKEFAKIAAPLYNLLKKDKKWEWPNECETAYQTLKERLISYPIIRKPNLSRPFIIYTDASTIALGAVLAQRDEGGEYACQFASRLLKGAERHYTIPN
jgi:predicted aspartyl protease